MIVYLGLIYFAIVAWAFRRDKQRRAARRFDEP